MGCTYAFAPSLSLAPSLCLFFSLPSYFSPSYPRLPETRNTFPQPCPDNRPILHLCSLLLLLLLSDTGWSIMCYRESKRLAQLGEKRASQQRGKVTVTTRVAPHLVSFLLGCETPAGTFFSGAPWDEPDSVCETREIHSPELPRAAFGTDFYPGVTCLTYGRVRALCVLVRHPLATVQQQSFYDFRVILQGWNASRGVGCEGCVAFTCCCCGWVAA